MAFRFANQSNVIKNVTQMLSIQDDFSAKRRNACIAGPHFSSFWKGLLSANAASEYSLKLQNALNNIDSMMVSDSSFLRVALPWCCNILQHLATSCNSLQQLATFIKETSKRQLPEETATLKALASQRADRRYLPSSPVSKAHMPFPNIKRNKSQRSHKSPIPPLADSATPQCGMQSDYCS